ncbi:hypothetical protein [Dyadobacter sp.]|uniref:hypothetical protein n=1 Tax=Dyadobacter sp. TaxID=1914288 RepID=UPI003F7118B0
MSYKVAEEDAGRCSPLLKSGHVICKKIKLLSTSAGKMGESGLGREVNCLVLIL